MSDISKQVIVVRRDLDMPAGKLAAQVAHAAMAFMTRVLRFTPDEEDIGYREGMTKAYRDIFIDEEAAPWIDGSFTKAVLMVHSEAELLEIYENAKKAGLRSVLITDEGRTVFGGTPTHTCVAVGPNFVERINAVTRHLKLYK